jgi:hypothetical protein
MRYKFPNERLRNINTVALLFEPSRDIKEVGLRRGVKMSRRNQPPAVRRLAK